jgi:hypothetical protein
MYVSSHLRGAFYQSSNTSLSRPPRGYDWKVIVDPTRSGDDPGFFYGRLFRMVDLQLDRDERSTWPDGIEFEHVHDRRRLIFREGSLFDLTHQKTLGRKPRIRHKKGKHLVKTKKNDISFPSQMRRFVLVRSKDLTGVSGTGVIAEGTLFSSGSAVIRWLRNPHAVGLYQTLQDVVTVHGHEGGTQIHFIDAPEKPGTAQGELQ